MQFGCAMWLLKYTWWYVYKVCSLPLVSIFLELCPIFQYVFWRLLSKYRTKYQISNKMLFLSVHFSFTSLIAEVNIVDAILNPLHERERSSVVKMLPTCHPWVFIVPTKGYDMTVENEFTLVVFLFFPCYSSTIAVNRIRNELFVDIVDSSYFVVFFPMWYFMPWSEIEFE